MTKQAAPRSVITTKEVTETQAVAFEKAVTESALYDKGTSRVTRLGVDGEKTLTYKVTLVDGVESRRELISERVTIAPISEVTTVGTYVKPVAPKVQTASNCDPNYSGVCVPVASDVDCAGGSGNGPAYVSGPVNIVGRDIYDLDRDGDGVGCE